MGNEGQTQITVRFHIGDLRTLQRTHFAGTTRKHTQWSSKHHYKAIPYPHSIYNNITWGTKHWKIMFWRCHLKRKYSVTTQKLMRQEKIAPPLPQRPTFKHLQLHQGLLLSSSPSSRLTAAPLVAVAAGAGAWSPTPVRLEKLPNLAPMPEMGLLLVAAGWENHVKMRGCKIWTWYQITFYNIL